MTKVNKRHISEEWDEGEDGYWIGLKSGFKWSGDPVGSVHVIHESTKEKAYLETVMICNCPDCIKETKYDRETKNR